MDMTWNLRAAGVTVALSLFLASTTNAQVTISPSHPELLQQQISAAYNAGQKSVTVPPGVYRIPVQNGFHLYFLNMANFEIDATGATFVFQDQTATGIVFNNCDHVFFHGATLYFATPPFSQGVIGAIAPDGSYLDVQIEPGYPTNLDDPTHFAPQLIAHLFDSSTRWWKRNVGGDIYGTGTQRLGTDTFRIFTRSLGGAAVGDLVGIRTGVGDHIIRVNSCSDMILQNLTILNSANFGIAESTGGDLGANHYLSITIKRGPRPPGATTDPVFSTSADGINSTEARTGPDVENCYLESMPDDALPVSGHYSWVMEASGNTLIVSNTDVYSGTNFNIGDPLRLIDANNQPAGEAFVTNVLPLPNYTNTRKSARNTVIDFTVGPYYQITLDRTLKAGFDYLAGNPNASGSGFIYRNNTIQNNRERGIGISADNGIVEGNVIDGTTVNAITIGPQFYWSGAGYSRNIVIRNNTIRNVGYWAGATAAISIYTDVGATAPGAMQNIIIDGNTLEDFDVAAMYITSVTGLVVSNNIFRNLQNNPPFEMNNVGENVLPGALIYVTQSDAVEFQGNTTSQLGAFNSLFVQASATGKVQGVAYTSVLASSDADFSGTQGGNNWYYGYFSAGNVNAFTQLPTFDATDQRWEHTTFGPPWTLVGASSTFHPNGADSGGEEWAVRRWMSTAAGSAKITGHLAKADTNPASPGVYGRLYLNHGLIYEHFLAGTDGVGADYSLTVTLHAGDIVDFAVAPNTSAVTSDSTVFTGSIVVTIPPPPPGNAPSIAAIANAASGQGGIASQTFISIYGQNFAPPGSNPGFLDTWSQSVIAGKLPTMLDGVTVTIGGQAAYVAALTPNQINVLTPSLPIGPAPVTVATSAGTTTFYTDVDPVEPALFTWPNNQAVATHLDFSPAASNGTFSAATIAAKPGETIILWGTGFGATTPAAPDGQVAPQGTYTVSGVNVTVGGQPVSVLGAALSPGYAGLYQTAIQLPSGMANGDYEVIVARNGVQSASGLHITVQM